MGKTFRYLALISFGAILASSTGMIFDLWRHNQTIQEAQIEETASARQNLAAGIRQYPSDSLYLAPAVSAWQVEIYSQEDQAFLNWPEKAAPANWNPPDQARATKLLGRFMHTGSWIDMAEYRKHHGIFVATPVSITVRGYIYSEFDDEFVFAVHFDNRAARRVSRDKYATAKTSWIRCRANLELNAAKTVIQHFTRFETQTPKAELRATHAVTLSGSGWHLVEATVSCSFPRSVDAADISFRICARRSTEGGFSPLRPVMPLPDVKKERPFNYIQSNNFTQRP